MGTPVNPEDAVIDAIDQLVDEQLAGGPVDDYSVDRYDRCRHCKQGWHGLPNDVGCPGAYARGYQIREWKRKLRTQPGYVKPRYDYVADVSARHAAAVRDQVDREILRGRGPLAAARASAQPLSRPAYQVWRCPTCQTTVARGQHCACPRNWQLNPQHRELDFPRWTQRCAYCGMERPMEQQECDCPPSRFARSLAHLTATSSLGSEAAQIAASGAEMIAQESRSVWAIDSSGPEISVSRVCIRCSRPLGMLHTYTSMDGTTPLCRDCFYYRVENSAQPWIPEAEAWADQERRG